jgi:DNA-binding CsgD family transcriptional regulator
MDIHVRDTTSGVAAGERAGVLEDLIYALADSGQVERSLSYLDALHGPGEPVVAERRCTLHVRLAWAASLAGRHEDGVAQVRAARALLGPDPSDEQTAPIDVIAAELAIARPDSASFALAETLARRAAAAAERVPLPEVACQAWLLIGCLIRPRDADAAYTCFERVWAIATDHHLPVWSMRALSRLGAHDVFRDGNIARLERARDEAQQAGAVTASYEADMSIAIHLVLFGDYAAARETSERIWAPVTRLRLTEPVQYTLFTRAVRAAHQGHRRDMDRALAELRRCGGDQATYPPVTFGLARAVCALLEEDRSRAAEELARADRWEDEHVAHFQLTGRYGLGVLLKVLDGGACEADVEAARNESSGRARWNRQFLHLARAALHGRAGRSAKAQEAAARAFADAAPYKMARHLGARLIAEAALADGWGTPVAWLRDAEGYFFTAGIPAIASACRSLLREAGAPVQQRRRGVERIPTSLRSLGVTVREFEILQLLVNRPGNRSIGARLHISPRTVEKHVASLIAKTGLADRSALGEYATQTLG